jgi:D-serine deaminase-like pyridoxal phosphate-dependent protein
MLSDGCAMIGSPVIDLETPLLAVDLDRLDRNIERMRRIIIEEGGTGWRPHSKAFKIPAIAHRLLAAGAHGITCAKLGEAEVMAAAGIRDILIANQVVGESKIARLMHLQRHADVIVAVDGEAHVWALDEAARKVGVRLRVVVEVDLGIHRAGVQPGDAVVYLAQRIAACRGLRFAGIMGWEGQTATIADPAEKRAAVEAAVAVFIDSADRCRAAGLRVDIVSCSGTGTYEITAGLVGVTEVQAGGGIFGDLRYLRDYGVEHEQALSVWTSVTSRPTPTRVICDAGWKAVAAFPRLPEPCGVGEVTLLKLSAEHATIELAAPSAFPEVGDRIELVVGYSDSTVFLHDVLFGVRGGVLEVAWPVLGRGKLR